MGAGGAGEEGSKARKGWGGGQGGVTKEEKGQGAKREGEAVEREVYVGTQRVGRITV